MTTTTRRAILAAAAVLPTIGLPSIAQASPDPIFALLPLADRELFAAYLRFAAAYQTVKDTEAVPGKDDGSVDSGTPEQKRAHRKWERALDRSDNLCRRFVAMPANTIEGMLLKIQVAGWRMETPGKGFKPLIDGPEWTLSPHFAHRDLPLLASLRDDLKRAASHPGRARASLR